MRAHYLRMIQETEKRVEYSLKLQITQTGEEYGAFCDREGVVQPKFAIYRATSAIAVYCNPDSKLYHDSKVYQMIVNALHYVISQQHENGLFDLVNCNFFSPPDTAFNIKRMFPALQYLNDRVRTPEEETIYQMLYAVIRRSADGLLTGGFHTPNHRWVIASQLMECGAFFEDETLRNAAQQYLNEGIDCNEDGEYAEKSSGNYNRINNRAMITMGHRTNDETFFQHAVRNLRMMLTYIQPDGSIFTGNSTRQDNGKRMYPKDYYMQYLEMGIRYHIDEFLDMANYIFDNLDRWNEKSPDRLIHYMNHPEWIDFEHEGSWKQPDFNCFYRDSGIARVKNKKYTYTLMQDKSAFLQFAVESMQIDVKVGAGYFEHRSFQPSTMEAVPEKNGYRLSETMQGWYYLPFEEKPETSDWWKMDHSKRKQKQAPNLKITAEITEEEDGICLHLKAAGVENAPLRVEMAVYGAQKLLADSFVCDALPGEHIVLKQGSVAMCNTSESIQIEGGFGTHLFTEGKFGSEAKSPYAFTVYCTDSTEFEHTLRFRIGQNVL